MTMSFKAKGLGIDVSNKTIAYATANTTAVNHHCVADGTKLEWLPTNFFDHAYSFGSIYHVYNETKFCHVLAEMVRVVKPGGLVYNGWTENKEFHRDKVASCVASTHHVTILEESREFRHVKNFPLKEHRTSPNTYSVLIQKGS
jgi:ubiquinone/menaquinone biosynthesis C-methylase UbiE